MKKLPLLFLFLLTSVLNGQTLSVFNVNTDNFPIIKANLSLTNARDEIVSDIFPGDFEVREGGIRRKIISVSCPEPKAPQSISVALSIDISGSMRNNRIENAKYTASELCKMIYTPPSEIALQECNTKANILYDFTTDKNTIINKIQGIEAGGGNDFVEHLLQNLSGLLNIAKTGKKKKIAIIFTDACWREFESESLQRCIDTCLKYEIAFYAILFSSHQSEQKGALKSLSQIAEATGGKCFDGIQSSKLANKVACEIQMSSQGIDPCEIQWESDFICKRETIYSKITQKEYNLSDECSYTPDTLSVSKLTFNPKYIAFKEKAPGSKYDTIVTVCASNSDFSVSEITSSNPMYSFSPDNFNLKSGDSINLALSYLPVDSSFTFSKFVIENDRCPSTYNASGFFVGVQPDLKTLNVTHPNGGEIFGVGADTIITWEGILKDEQVMIEYSINDGGDWDTLTTYATGLQYNWKDIPRPASDNCLVKVKQIAMAGDLAVPMIEWQMKYGGYRYDDALDILQTDDGGYLLVGSTESKELDVSFNHGNRDVWIIKIGPGGNILWEKTYGGSAGDWGLAVTPALDGGFLITAGTSSNDGDVTDFKGNGDYFIFKIDETGKIIWARTYGGSLNDKIRKLIRTRDGAYIVLGESWSDDGDISEKKGELNSFDADLWVTKIDASGNLLKEKCFGGSLSESGYEIVQTADGGFIILGKTSSDDGDLVGMITNDGMWIIKLDEELNIEWQKIYGGGLRYYPQNLLITADNEYYLAGMFSSDSAGFAGYHDGYDYFVMKLDEKGDSLWARAYGGIRDDLLNDAIFTSDGQILLVGAAKSSDGDVSRNQGNSDYWLVKINLDGDILWEKSYGGNSLDEPFAARRTAEGAFIVAGKSHSYEGDTHVQIGGADMWVVKLTPDGKVVQEDESDDVFSIKMPSAVSLDIDMGKALVNTRKDSLVYGYIENTGECGLRLDSIYIRGKDSAVFSILSYLPDLPVEPGSAADVEFNFSPTKSGYFAAEIVLITQSDTIIHNIIGEGGDPDIENLSDLIDFGKVKLWESKDTVKAIIKNSSSGAVAITGTGIIGPDTDQFKIISGGGAFDLSPGEERTLTLRFSPIRLGRTNTELAFYFEGLGSPVAATLFGEGIRPDIKCGPGFFEYPDFSDMSELNLVDNAKPIDKYIRLTSGQTAMRGALWRDELVPVNRGFVTGFQFRLSDGDNLDSDDGSPPGADGLAFVIQNSAPNAIGDVGGGLGYHNIENAFAVEFDVFTNNDDQIENYFDPNGNHVAVQSGGSGEISSKHTDEYCLGYSKFVDNIYADGTIYSAKIEYNIEPGIFNVYLGTEDSLDYPILTIGDMSIGNIIELDESSSAYVGITAATGKAVERHDILNWYFCPLDNNPGVSVERKGPENINLRIKPNPASDDIKIEFFNKRNQYIDIKIADIFGTQLETIVSEIHSLGFYSYHLSTNNLNSGIYFAKIRFGEDYYFRKIIINK